MEKLKLNKRPNQNGNYPHSFFNDHCALITWWVSKHYYQKAGKELQTEASELKKLNTLMLRAMEKAGLAKFNRDEHGNLKGIVIELSTKIKASSQTPDIDIHIK